MLMYQVSYLFGAEWKTTCPIHQPGLAELVADYYRTLRVGSTVLISQIWIPKTEV